MTYLFGDSSPSTLGMNFLDFLRAGVEQAAEILRAEERMIRCAEEDRAREREAAALAERLESLGGQVSGSLQGCSGEPSDSPIGRLRDRITRAAEEAVRKELADLQKQRAAETERARQKRAEQKSKVVEALEALVVSHSLPDARGELRLDLGENLHYAATWRARTDYGLDLLVQLELPEESPFSRDMRMQQLAEGLEIHAPETAGWIRKETKMVAHKVGKLHLSALSISPEAVALELRTAIEAGATGYDISVDRAKRSVSIARVNGEVERFDVAPEDATQLRDLVDRLIVETRGLESHRKALVRATFDGQALSEHEKPSELVERMMENAGPVAREIQRHSQSTSELVLRRQLGDNRREEIFVTKRELLQMIQKLPEERWSLFEPLGLGRPDPLPPAPEEKPDSVPRLDSELLVEDDPAEEPVAEAEPEPEPEPELETEPELTIEADEPEDEEEPVRDDSTTGSIGAGTKEPVPG